LGPAQGFVAFALDATLQDGPQNDLPTDGDGNDAIHGGSGDNTLDGGNSIDQLFGGDGNDWLVFSGPSDTDDGGIGIDALRLTGAAEFTRFNEKTASIETLDLRNGELSVVTLNTEDVLTLGRSTGEIVYGSHKDLVVRGDTRADNVNLQHAGNDHFTLQMGVLVLSDPV